MRKVSITSAAGAFMLFASLLLYAQPEQTKTPPISQPLVSEGTFARKLVSSLKLGSPNSEEQAEDILAAAGITPRNGWIADYPLTPIIIGQVEQAMLAAAGSEKLPISKEEAQKIFEEAITDYGLAVTPAQGQYSGQPDRNDGVQPGVVNSYYYDQGPPVVTYYPPPWDYSYLYAYVPYPFYGFGLYFPGFYMLNDFAIYENGRFGRHFLSNHIFDGRSHSFARINPRSGFITGSNANTRIITGSNGFSYSGRFGGSTIRGSGLGGNRSLSNRNLTNGGFSRSFGTQQGMGGIGRSGSLGIRGGSGGFRGGGGFGGFRGGGGGHR
jgi:hypothetical protein